MRVLVVTTQVPFVRGGAEFLTDGLRDALRAHGHEVDVVAIPFRWHPASKVLDHMLACHLLDVSDFTGAPVDRVICLRFPSYLVQHDAKVLWLLHQHRQAVDMWDHELSDVRGHPQGAAIREGVLAADRTALAAVRRRFAISDVVGRRLADTVGLEAETLHPPLPDDSGFRNESPEPFVFLPSRITRMKRQALLVEALARTPPPPRLVLAGSPDSPYEEAVLAERIEACGVADRVDLVGPVDDREKQRLYATCAAVAFAPIDEDYGYVTIEAMCSGKPVITCTDSGGPLDFVVDGDNGAVADPEPEAMADAFVRVAGDLAKAQVLGDVARDRYLSLDLTWSRVIDRLLD